MLVIRRAQMEAFGVVAQQAFEARMVGHLAAFSPPLFRTLGEQQMRAAVRLGIRRAAAHGLDLQGPVRLYLEMTLLFGSRFDTDPQYPWAATALAGADDQMQRATRLYEQMIDYREAVAGPEDAHHVQALRRILAMAGQDSAGDESELRRLLQAIHPQKAAYVGDRALDALIAKGRAEARRLHFSTPRAATLLVLLMLAFGHGCCGDPLYPWIARTLNADQPADADRRAARLERRSLTWLRHVLAAFDDPRNDEPR
jgi:hypothetical protein